MTEAFTQRLSEAIDQEFRASGQEPARCVWMSSVASTNQWALDLEPERAPMPPLLVGCDVQQAGRGRRGRGWVSQPEQSLTFSLVFERQASEHDALAGYSLVVGLSLCETLSADVASLRLKWPNDLLRQGRKCAGILVETRRFERMDAPRIERVVCGIGLNLSAPQGLAPEVAKTVTGLFEDRMMGPADRARLLAKIALRQVVAWQEFAAVGFGPTMARWHSFDALQGQPVRVLADPMRPESELMHGVAQGVAPDGALVIATSQGLRKVYAGEISVRSMALE